MQKKKKKRREGQKRLLQFFFFCVQVKSDCFAFFPCSFSGGGGLHEKKKRSDSLGRKRLGRCVRGRAVFLCVYCLSTRHAPRCPSEREYLHPIQFKPDPDLIITSDQSRKITSVFLATAVASQSALIGAVLR